MPTATDLVTDLPADFEVFGQAVATSMADLLGGTTGQILSKTSATDMDFTWIANDQGDITGITAGTGITVTSPTGPVPTVSINTAVTADLTTAQTLTNKTLTTPIIASISNTGTLTLPTSTDTLVGRATTDTLTNKTLTSPALTTPTISTLTTNGDLLYGTGSGALARKAIGSTGQVLTVAAGIPSWATPSGGSPFAADISVNGLTIGKGTASQSDNTALGVSALLANTTGQYNTAVGKNALTAATTGGQNTAVGRNTAVSLTTGVQNVAIGQSTLATGTTSSYNVAIGVNALRDCTADYNNGVGQSSGLLITSGVQNVFYGAFAGDNTTTGSNNVAIGYAARPSNATVSDSVTLGNSSISTLRCQQTSITALSDERDKTNIEPVQLGLDFVNELKPVTFDWAMRPEYDENGDVINNANNGKSETGFIAQDLLALQNKYDTEAYLKLVEQDNPERLEASAGKLLPILVKAIQDLSAKVAALEANA